MFFLGKHEFQFELNFIGNKLKFEIFNGKKYL